MVTYIRNISTRGRSKRIVSFSSLLVTEFEASLGYKRLCLKVKETKT